MLQVPVEVIDAETGLIAFDDEDGGRVQQSAFGGTAKLQWKVDWAVRWVALGVDYEMSGKDLIDSVIQSGKIARVLGGRPPEGFNYEMFLDEKGEKISKSKGNGLSLEEWLRYGTEESLGFYIYREPKARRACTSASSRAPSTNIGSSAAIIRASRSSRSSATRSPHPRRQGAGGDAAADLRLAAQPRRLPGVADRTPRGSSSSAMHRARRRKRPGARRADRPGGQLCARFRRADSQRRAPTDEAEALRDLDSELAKLPADASAEEIQTQVFEVGKRHPFESLRGWFQALYETLLGSARARAWAASSHSTGSTTAAS